MTIMNNRITTTITTIMLMLFSFGINVFAQSENVVPSGYPELDEWVKQCKVERPNALGYPGNYDSKLDSFYDWYTQNKMENILTLPAFCSLVAKFNGIGKAVSRSRAPWRIYQ